MELTQKGFSALIVILIVVIIAVAGSGAYLYIAQTQKPKPQVQKPVVENQTNQKSSQKQTVPKQTENEIDTSNWKTYRNEEYGFEFKYPRNWKVNENLFSPEPSLVFCPEDLADGYSSCKTKNGGAGTPKPVYEKGMIYMFASDTRKDFELSAGFGGIIPRHFYFYYDNENNKKAASQMLSTFRFVDASMVNLSGPLDLFIPSGWRIINKAEGDLNGDELPDAAIVVEDQRSAKNKLSCYDDKGREDKNYCQCFADYCPRVLLILFQQKDGNYRLSVKSGKAILMSGEGGMFDPFENIEINKRALVVHFYGGSSWRWGDDYKFRYQDNGWYLIGKTSLNYQNSCPNQIFKTEDYNYLTGYMEKFTGDGWDGINWKEGFECDESLRSKSGKKEIINTGKKTLLDLRLFDHRYLEGGAYDEFIPKILERFYDWHFACEGGELNDCDYRYRIELTDKLKEKLDMSADYDQLMCSQDPTHNVAYGEPRIIGGRATVIMRQKYLNAKQIVVSEQDIVIELIKIEGYWKINNVICPKAEEAG